MSLTQTEPLTAGQIDYRSAKYLLGVPRFSQLPADNGIEVAFAGRSNAGKSSALNCLADNKRLARASKTPGRTQLINLFSLDLERRLVDLPGYGYAKAPLSVKKNWQSALAQYLQKRQCLQGLVLIMDIRHPLKELDQNMLQWSTSIQLPTHILLSKSDKLKKGPAQSILLQVQKEVAKFGTHISCQKFSSLKKQGLDLLKGKLDQWYTD